jgi:GWxTD domain-containing protein
LSYAKALSFLEEHRSTVPAVALGASGGSLATRIRRLLGGKEPPAISRLAAATLLTAAFVAMGLCIGAMAHAQSTTSDRRATENANSAQNLSPYQRWLSEEVPYIITDEERSAFKKLSTDEEREAFIEQFWERRNPNPGSPENKFKEEYYRRIAYANEHYAGGIPGWKTDRGRIYIVYGPPDEIDAFLHGSASHNFAKPTQIWRYRHIQEYAPPKQVIVQGRTELKAQTTDRLNVTMKFVDVCSCGDYRLEPPPQELIKP